MFMILRLEDVGKSSPDIGKKGYYLSCMLKEGFPVPPAFAITPSSFCGLYGMLESLSIGPDEDVAMKSARIQDSILNSTMPRDLEHEIIRQYTEMEVIPNLPKNTARFIMAGRDLPSVAVRVSGETEMPFASSMLNVYGAKQVIFAIKKVIANLFSSNMLVYKNMRKIPDSVFLNNAVIVQKYIPADFYGTAMIHPYKDGHILIEYANSSNNLGSLVYGSSDSGRIYFDSATKGISEESRPAGETIAGKYDVGKIVEHLQKAEEIFGEHVCLEWCIARDRINILGARKLKASPKSAKGRAKRNFGEITKGDIMLADNCNINVLPFADKICGIVVEHGSYSSRLSFLCRELSIPFLIDPNSKDWKENAEISIGESPKGESLWKVSPLQKDKETLRITKLAAIINSKDELLGGNIKFSDELIISKKELLADLEQFEGKISYLSSEADELEGLKPFGKCSRILLRSFDAEKMEKIKNNGAGVGCFVSKPYDMLRIKDICSISELEIFDVGELVQLMSDGTVSVMDEVILKQIQNAVRRCKESGSECYCANFAMEKESPENLLSQLILSGFAGIVIPLAEAENFDFLVQKAEKKILLDMARKSLA